MLIMYYILVEKRQRSHATHPRCFTFLRLKCSIHHRFPSQLRAEWLEGFIQELLNIVQNDNICNAVAYDQALYDYKKDWC